MDVNRRHLIGASAASVAGALAMSPDAARAAPLTSALGRDATQYGVRPGSPDDQTKVLQRAIDEAARAQVPLALPPGAYRTGMLRLQNGTQLIGVRGATKLVFNGSASMFSGEGANSVGLTNITLDGSGIALPTRRGLVHCIGGRDIRIVDCEISGSGCNGIWFENVSGDVSGNIITRSAATAIVSFDAQGLSVSRNTILGTNDNGIEILRTAIGDDGTLVTDNRIELVLNQRVPHPPLDRAAIESILGRKVSVSIGFDDSRPEDAALAGGLVLVRDPNSLVSRGATDLARVIVANLKMDG